MFESYLTPIECVNELILDCPLCVTFDKGRFEDAELDCTEAIALDDRYTKAYARRGTARKELKNYLSAAEGACQVLELIVENSGSY